MRDVGEGKRRKLRVWHLIVGVVLVVIVGIWRGDRVRALEPLPQAETLSEFAKKIGHERRIRRAAEVFGIDPNVKLGLRYRNSYESRAPRRELFPDGTSVLTIWCVDGARFMLYEETGRVLYYSNRPSEEKSSLLDTPLSEKEFLELLEDVLEAEILRDELKEQPYFGFGEPDISKSESSPSKENQIGTPVIKEWKAYVRRTYKGFEYFRPVIVSADAATGVITSVHTVDPFVGPEVLLENVTKDEALRVAKSIYETRRYPISNLDARQLIVHPNNEWDRDSVRAEELPVETRLCWVVSWKFVQSGSGLTYREEVYVDSETGEIVGGLNATKNNYG